MMKPSGCPSRALDPSVRTLAFSAAWDWPEFWAWANQQLRAAGYRKSTRKMYRQALRGFHRYLSTSSSNSGFRSETQACPGPCPTKRAARSRKLTDRSRVSNSPCPLPGEISSQHIRAYLNHLGARRLSASWIGMNTSVLRTLFDRLAVSTVEPIAGRNLTHNLRSPRCPRRLPRTLSHAEIRTLLSSAPNPRDRLLLSLIYGCGLKVSEAASMRWNQFTDDGRLLNIPASGTAPERCVPVPERLLALVKDGCTWAFPDAYVFPGRRSDRPLSPRTAEHIIRQCVLRARLSVTTTSMTLRHSFAVHALESGMNVRALQEILGHRSVETTLRYQRCLVPADAGSPLDALPLPELLPEPVPLSTRSPTPTKPRPAPLRLLGSLLESALGKRPPERPPS